MISLYPLPDTRYCRLTRPNSIVQLVGSARGDREALLGRSNSGCIDIPDAELYWI